MLYKIYGGCYSQNYGSSTCDGAKIGGVVSKKLTSSFHISSEISYSLFEQIPIFS